MISQNILDDLVENLCHVDAKNTEDFSELNKEYNCKIEVSIQKHNVLQYTFYYEIDFGLEENYFVEIESGISNGTQINSQEWGNSTKPKSEEIEVLKDVVFCEEAFDKWYYGNSENKDFVKRKAIAIFENNKSELLKLHREQSYDDYVTGGGTNKTDSYYKNKKNELREKGVFWEYVYETKEVDCNFIK